VIEGERGPFVWRVWRENVFGRKGQMSMLQIKFEKQIEHGGNVGV